MNIKQRIPGPLLVLMGTLFLFVPELVEHEQVIPISTGMESVIRTAFLVLACLLIALGLLGVFNSEAPLYFQRRGYAEAESWKIAFSGVINLLPSVRRLAKADRSTFGLSYRYNEDRGYDFILTTSNGEYDYITEAKIRSLVGSDVFDAFKNSIDHHSTNRQYRETLARYATKLSREEIEIVRKYGTLRKDSN